MGKCKSEPELLGSQLPTSQVCVRVSESLVLWDLNMSSSEQAAIAASIQIPDPIRTLPVYPAVLDTEDTGRTAGSHRTCCVLNCETQPSFLRAESTLVL